MRRPKRGTKIAIVAPSSSMDSLKEEFIDIGVQRITEMGFVPSFGKSVCNAAGNIQDRVKDIHDAFLDSDTTIIMAVYGGYNSNDLLEHLDYDLIANHKKLFIGYSDITTILNALYIKSNLITVHGPGFASLCNPNLLESSLKSLKSIVYGGGDYTLVPPSQAIYDKWYAKAVSSKTKPYLQPAWHALKRGRAVGVLVGGNIDSLLALAGTEYFPSLEDHVLMLESITDDHPNKLQRGLMQLRHMGAFSRLRGLIIGQYPPTNDLYKLDVISHVLNMATTGYSFPIMINVNCSHVDPLYSLPIGGRVQMECVDPCSIKIIDSIYTTNRISEKA